jgi:SAM-dependent methyltransferase
VDGADPKRWSAVAEGWAELWGGYPEPAWRAILDACGAGPGTRLLDVGCGSGDLLAYASARGLAAAGIDPAPGMVECARTRLPATDIRLGDAEDLPWPDAHFDLAVSVNALQFAGDTLDALAEMTRITTPTGHVAVANWAEGTQNDLNVIEEAIARAGGEDPLPDGELRHPGGLERLLTEGGLTVVDAGLVPLPWHAADDGTLVRGVLLGEDEATMAALAPVVLAAARPYRTKDGRYRLVNAFRYAVARPRDPRGT